ncbi:hypothetical protein GCM10010300_09250 [Streptomyces olivaceoviridis]|nr:hypothetical protein GCM10010300_09250 [Streptomyces olivaceoviridis]
MRVGKDIGLLARPLHTRSRGGIGMAVGVRVGRCRRVAGRRVRRVTGGPRSGKRPRYCLVLTSLAPPVQR